MSPADRPLDLRWVAVLLGVLAAGGLSLLGTLRGETAGLRGDAGTYLAMTASLALDGDLLFSASDLERLRSAGPDAGRGTVILQRSETGVTYSKPALYPLLAAPFYRLAGQAGPPLLNALALGASLLLAWWRLRRLGGSGEAALALATFAGTGVLAAYVPWHMSDALQAALSLAGLSLVMGRARADALEPPERPAAVWIGGALLGLCGALRYPNLLVGAAAVVGLALDGRRKRAAVATLAAAVALLAVLATNRALLGTAEPYRAPRASFTPATGYPDVEDASAGANDEGFRTRRATQRMGLVPDFDPRVSAYAALYFLVGRHTGLLFYFPAALIFAACLLGQRDRAGAILLCGALALAVFYLVWWPRNYFGGSTFLGNRYILVAYPLLLVGLARLPRARTLALAWIVATISFASALASVTRTAGSDRGSQSHAHAGVFRLAPYESTAADIDGRRDRYWSTEFVRFVDPYAEVQERSFRLGAGQPAAELLVARPCGYGPMRFHVRGGAPPAVLEVSEGSARRSYELGGTARGLRRVVELEPAPAWRRHRFWWHPDEVYCAHSVRLRLVAAEGGTREVEVRYLGQEGVPEGVFGREVLDASLPAVASPGSALEVPLRLRNTGREPWSSDGVLPVLLAWRLDPPGGGPMEAGRQPLPALVPPGETIETALYVELPAGSGRHRLVVDLLLEGVDWFEHRVGEPVAEGWITVE